MIVSSSGLTQTVHCGRTIPRRLSDGRRPLAICFARLAMNPDKSGRAECHARSGSIDLG